MTIPYRDVIAALVLSIALAGCQSRLNDQRTVKLDPNKDQFITLDAPKYDQTLTLIMSADVAVDVYVFLEKDQEEVDRLVSLGQKSDKLLASRQKTQSDTLDAKVPAKEKAVILVRSSKIGTATLKMVGK